MSTTAADSSTAARMADADRAHIIHPYLPSTTTERVIMV